MSLDAMKQALRAAEFADLCIKELVTGSTNREVAKQVLSEAITALRAAIEQAHDWDEVEALRESLREHMAEIHRLRQWQSLTDNEIALICGECAASTHQTDDLSYARAIEARLREKNS